MTVAVNSPSPRPVRAALAIIAISAALNLIAAALLVYSNFSQLWPMPAGTHFRSQLPYTNLVGGAAALLQTLFLSAVALMLGWKSKRVRILAILLILLGVVPLIAAGTAFAWIVGVHQLELD
jgi:ABC-type sugar transport system permease subunit